jgi:hypothetical protein
MRERTIFVDASVFLGMHHRDESVRNHSLWFFRHQYAAAVKMNYEQVGICDAVIWQESREVQDLYYPFMDRLHTCYVPQYFRLAASPYSRPNFRPCPDVG